MKPKLVVAISAIAAIPVLAHALNALSYTIALRAGSNLSCKAVIEVP